METPYTAHALALVESDEIGQGTRIWAWAHVMSGARVGRDCNIGEHCFVESGAVVGHRVTLKNGVAVWDGITVEDDVFIGPAASLTNDLCPRSRAPGFVPQPTRLCRGATIGANATILCNLTVGCYAFVGAGAVVTRDVPDFALVLGSPARLEGHVCRCAQALEFDPQGQALCSCGARFEKTDGNVTPLESPSPG